MQDIPYDVSHVPIDYDNSIRIKETSDKDERRDQREQRAALERDVAQLQKKLLIEINMRNALSRGLSRPLGSLPRIYASLPVEIRELLLEVAVLEEEIISLEKQVIYLGREVEIQAMPPMDDETICYEKDSDQTIPSDKADVILSPAVSPRDCARMNPKPSLSPSKSFNQKSSLSKTSVSVSKSAEIKSSAVKISIPSRNSTDYGSSIKSIISSKDSIEPKRIVTAVPQKTQIPKSGSTPKVSLKNSRDFKSRRLSLTKIEPHEAIPPSTHTIGPFIPLQLSFNDDEENTLAASPAPVSPSDVGKTIAKPPRIKTDNLKPPLTGSARLKVKNSLTSNVAPVARPLKSASTPRPSAQDRGPLNSSRMSRQSVTLASSTNRKKPSAATLEQRVNALETSSAPLTGESILRSSHQKPADTKDAIYNMNIEDIPSHEKIDGDDEPIVHSPNHAKVSQQTCSPEKIQNRMDSLQDSVFLSEEVVKFLASIYGNLQEKQATPASDTGSSRASTSTTLSSASPDDYSMKRGTNSNFKLDACHAESFRSKRSASIRYVQDCLSGEVAGASDPHTCSNIENINTRTIFHQRLMS